MKPLFGDETIETMKPNTQIENLLSSLKSESISVKSEIEKLECNLRSLSLSNNNLKEDNQILISKESSLQDRIIVLEHALQAALEENNKLKEDEQWQQVQNMCYTNANSQAKMPPTHAYFESQNSYDILRDLNDQTSAADPEDFKNSQTARRSTGQRNPEKNKARRSRRKERVLVLGDSQEKYIKGENLTTSETQVTVKPISGLRADQVTSGFPREIKSGVKSVQSALSDLLTTSATHGTFSRPSTKRGLILIIKLLQFTIVRFF